MSETANQSPTDAGANQHCQNGPVIFDYQEWSEYFPALASVILEKEASFNFRRAVNFIGSAGPDCLIEGYEERKEVLYDLTAFFCLLMRQAVSISPSNNGSSGAINANAPGMIQDAHMGSVSIEYKVLANADASYTENFLSQNQFGAMAWILIQRYLHGPIYETVGRPLRDYQWP